MRQAALLPGSLAVSLAGSLAVSLAGSLLPCTATAQVQRAPFDAAWIAFPDNTSIVATGDFDADGDVDGIGWYWQDTNYWQGWLRTWLNDGNGNFNQIGSSDLVYVRQTETWDVRVGRLDRVPGDDWVAAFRDTVFTSTGLRWTEPAMVKSARLFDYDGDGLDDLALLGAEVRLFHNDGAAYRLVATLAVGAFREMHQGELNGDGVTDLLCCSTSSLQVVLVSASGALTAGASHPITTVFSESVMFAVGDVDGDLDDDAVVFIDRAGGINGNAEYMTLRRTGSASFQLEARASGGPATGFADIDGDGDLDGVCCGGGGPLPAHNAIASNFHLSINDGTGRFAKAWQIHGVGAFRFAGFDDVDGDGARDLVAGRAVFFNRNGFRVQPQPTGMTLPNGSGRVAWYDQDLDGDLDAVTSHSARHDNDGAGTIAQTGVPWERPASGAYGGAPIAGDFDGDGDVDLIVRHGDSTSLIGMRVLWNNGGGGYTAGHLAAGPGGTFSNSTTLSDLYSRAVVGDLDNDGDQDIVVGNSSGFIAFRPWINDGNANFTNSQLVFGGQPHALVDLDRDGFVDLVTSDSVHWGLGNGTFTNRSNVPVQVAMDGQLAIADLDRDGDLDLAFGDAPVLTILWNQGGRGFAQVDVTLPIPLYTSSGQVERAAIADLDGDGNLDVMVGPAHWYHGNSTLVMYGNGVGGWRGHTLLALELGPLCDVDGDGDLDVAGPRLYRGAAAQLPQHGYRRQYGTGSAGLGGMVPQLGAAGPFHAGKRIDLRISGARGGAFGFVLLGLQPADLADWPIAGMRGFVAPPQAIVPVVAGGAAGIAGNGALVIPVLVPPALSGITVFHQVLFVDPAASAGATFSRGLELRYR